MKQTNISLGYAHVKNAKAEHTGDGMCRISFMFKFDDYAQNNEPKPYTPGDVRTNELYFCISEDKVNWTEHYETYKLSYMGYQDFKIFYTDLDLGYYLASSSTVGKTYYIQPKIRRINVVDLSTLDDYQEWSCPVDDCPSFKTSYKPEIDLRTNKGFDNTLPSAIQMDYFDSLLNQTTKNGIRFNIKEYNGKATWKPQIVISFRQNYSSTNFYSQVHNATYDSSSNTQNFIQARKHNEQGASTLIFTGALDSNAIPVTGMDFTSGITLEGSSIQTIDYNVSDAEALVDENIKDTFSFYYLEMPDFDHTQNPTLVDRNGATVTSSSTWEDVFTEPTDNINTDELFLNIQLKLVII